MNTLPLVTINIPTYKQAKYIRRAIESAAGQDYPNLQVVVCDDCSPDRTFEAARELQSSRVEVHQTPKNLGRVANYRYMLYELAKGEWVVNLDGDDYYNDPTFISTAVRLLQQHPSAVMWAGGASVQDEATGRIHQAPIHLPRELTLMKGTDYVLRFYKAGQIGQHFSILYNRKRALETDFYVLDSLGADTDSICRLALTGDVVVQKKWVGVWTSHSGNASYTLNTATVQKELAMLEHIASAARRVLPEGVVDQWLKESQALKYRNALYASLPGMGFQPALRALLRHWSWKKQDAKELIKIFLRLIKR